jgi:hypothetical protein
MTTFFILIFIITPGLKSFVLIAEERGAFKVFSSPQRKRNPCLQQRIGYNYHHSAVDICRNESIRAVLSQFLAKWSVNSRYCLSPQGEFIGWSGMSPEVQKEHGSANAGSPHPPSCTPQSRHFYALLVKYAQMASGKMRIRS